MSDLYARALQILQQSTRRDDVCFHEHQWEAISTLVEERGRLLVVQRTGWGKSAVYFIATKLMREQGRGPTIILSPLLALMRNQIEAAWGYGIQLGTINSAKGQAENGKAEQALLDDELDAVIVSPERLANIRFVENVLRPVANRVGLLVIDEVHCISDWGHDFRPDYKRIMNILKFLPANVAVLGTTATANDRVIKDVAAQLVRIPKILRGPLARESLHLQTISFPQRSQRLAWLADTVPRLTGTGIIYVATVRDGDLVARWLKSRGIAVAAYSGRTPNGKEARPGRLELEEALLANRLKALVATSALGMGYDKPDLSFVIHFQSPGSVIGYYQQVGRAGRGIPRAYGVLMSGREDDEIQQYFIRNAFPGEQLVGEILEALEAAEDGLKLWEIGRRVNGARKKIKAALTFLSAESPAPVVMESGRYKRTLIDYELPHDLIRRILARKQQEWCSMQAYLEHDGCLMQFLARELDDHETDPCGKCANCAPGAVLTQEYDHATALEAADFVRRVNIEIQPKRQAGSPSQIPERFPEYQLPPRLGELEHEWGRALCRWGEAGWGELAKSGKSAGRFDPRLVGAAVELIRKRWRPTPPPAWVTFVPSHAHVDLVPCFAKQLAAELGLPCLDVVKKVKKNRPQKTMENTEHRCQNLDGVFEITPDVQAEPVLLIDDAVDSGWTFAVVAAILRRAGAGPVFPFAIMSTATSR